MAEFPVDDNQLLCQLTMFCKINEAGIFEGRYRRCVEQLSPSAKEGIQKLLRLLCQTRQECEAEIAEVVDVTRSNRQILPRLMGGTTKMQFGLDRGDLIEPLSPPGTSGAISCDSACSTSTQNDEPWDSVGSQLCTKGKNLLRSQNRRLLGASSVDMQGQDSPGRVFASDLTRKQSDSAFRDNRPMELLSDEVISPRCPSNGVSISSLALAVDYSPDQATVATNLATRIFSPRVKAFLRRCRKSPDLFLKHVRNSQILLPEGGGLAKAIHQTSRNEETKEILALYTRFEVYNCFQLAKTEGHHTGKTWRRNQRDILAKRLSQEYPEKFKATKDAYKALGSVNRGQIFKRWIEHFDNNVGSLLALPSRRANYEYERSFETMAKKLRKDKVKKLIKNYGLDEIATEVSSRLFEMSHHGIAAAGVPVQQAKDDSLLESEDSDAIADDSEPDIEDADVLLEDSDAEIDDDLDDSNAGYGDSPTEQESCSPLGKRLHAQEPNISSKSQRTEAEHEVAYIPRDSGQLGPVTPSSTVNGQQDADCEPVTRGLDHHAFEWADFLSFSEDEMMHAFRTSPTSQPTPGSQVDLYWQAYPENN